MRPDSASWPRGRAPSVPAKSSRAIATPFEWPIIEALEPVVGAELVILPPDPRGGMPAAIDVTREVLGDVEQGYPVLQPLEMAPQDLVSAPVITASADEYTLGVQTRPGAMPGTMWWRGLIKAGSNRAHTSFESIRWSLGFRTARGQLVPIQQLGGAPGFAGLEYRSSDAVPGPIVVIAEVKVPQPFWFAKTVQIALDVPLPPRPAEACVLP